jgi:hypothetical protein
LSDCTLRARLTKEEVEKIKAQLIDAESMISSLRRKGAAHKEAEQEQERLREEVGREGGREGGGQVAREEGGGGRAGMKQHGVPIPSFSFYLAMTPPPLPPSLPPSLPPCLPPSLPQNIALTREKVHLSSTVTKLQSRNEALETHVLKRFEQFENLNAKLADNEEELVKLKEGERRRKVK